MTHARLNPTFPTTRDVRTFAFASGSLLFSSDFKSALGDLAVFRFRSSASEPKAMLVVAVRSGRLTSVLTRSSRRKTSCGGLSRVKESSK